jgi:hypothetical protein
MVDCYYLYFMLEKEETLNSFKKQFPNLLSSVQIEFRETEKYLDNINIDKDICFDWRVKKLLILWHLNITSRFYDYCYQ